MIIALLIIIAVLVLALWVSAMALWWRSEQEREAELASRDIVRQWNKARRLARRGWYASLRQTKRATAWGSKQARNAFIAIFPDSKAAFVDKDLLTGLEHGPSSYFLANLSKPTVKPKAQRRKKTVTLEVISEEPEHLSEE